MEKEKSCGTIIINDGKVLVIKQLGGFYGFPKGHMEKGEDEVTTALRETKEETNLDVVIDSKKRYENKYLTSRVTEKTVIFFLGHAKNPKEAKAQEEELSSLMWVPLNKVRETLTYDDLKLVWDEVLNDYEF